jgi:uncharacterized protein
MLQRAACLLSVGLLAAQTAPDPGAIARKAVDLMLGGKYQELNQMFTPEGQKVYSVDALNKLDGQIKSWGTPSNIGAPTVTRPGPNFVVVIPVSFASQNINFTAMVTPEGKIAIFLQRPGEMAWQRPSYVKPEAFHEKGVTVGDGDWKLPATLSVPAGNGPFPAVVLVQDSGPHDRDETIFAAKPFRDLAEGLASRGVVVLRYEKRSRVYAARLAAMPKVTVREQTEEDALKALALLRAQPEVNQQKIYLLGHGLSGYLAPRIAEEDGKLAGIIIVDANERPLEDVMVDQAAYLLANRPAGANGPEVSADKELELVKANAARVKALEPADSDSPPIMGMSAAFILDLKGYDPMAVAKGIPARVLVMQGGRDFEITAKDFDLWKAGLAGRKDATFHLYPALNHLLVAGQGKSSEAEYHKPGHVAPDAVDDIAKFVTQ